MSNNQITVMLWIGVGVIRWLIWNKNAAKARMYDDQERLKFQIMHLVLFSAVGPFGFSQFSGILDNNSFLYRNY